MAITTLYLMETSRHNQFAQASLKAVQRAMSTHRPTKTSKIRTWQNMHHFAPTNSYRDIGNI